METTKGLSFGPKISEAKVISTDELATSLANADAATGNFKVSGEVVEVCKNEGCWLRLKTASGSMMVRIKDHSFLVPVSMVGHTVVVEGSAKIKEVSVELQKHYAEDAGKSKAEIDAITQPAKEPVMQAVSLVVAN